MGFLYLVPANKSSAVDRHGVPCANARLDTPRSTAAGNGLDDRGAWAASGCRIGMPIDQASHARRGKRIRARLDAGPYGWRTEHGALASPISVIAGQLRVPIRGRIRGRNQSWTRMDSCRVGYGTRGLPGPRKPYRRGSCSLLYGRSG